MLKHFSNRVLQPYRTLGIVSIVWFTSGRFVFCVNGTEVRRSSLPGGQAGWCSVVAEAAMDAGKQTDKTLISWHLQVGRGSSRLCKVPD